MSRLLTVIALGLAAVFGLVLAVLNNRRVQVDLLWAEVDAPVSLVIVAGIGTGVLLGMLAALGPLVRAWRENRRLRRALAGEKKRNASRDLNL